MSTTLSINRAPLLTLWGAVVAQRLGFDEDEEEALSLGKPAAGLNTQAKGRRLGLFQPYEEKAEKARAKAPGEVFRVEVCGRPVPATNTEQGIRAVRVNRLVAPDGVRRYLEGKFGKNLKAVQRTAMRSLRTLGLQTFEDVPVLAV
jgi:hypothetical protein